MNHILIIEGVMKAKCSCGTWEYIGITPEARKSIEDVFQYHAPGKVRKMRAKKKKKRK